MDQIFGGERNDLIPRHLGRVYTEDLVKPDARIGQPPEPQQDVHYRRSDQENGRSLYHCWQNGGRMESETRRSVEEDRIWKLELYPFTQLAVHARIKKLHLFIGISVAAVRKAAVIRLGINMDADRAFVEFCKVEHLVNRLFE